MDARSTRHHHRDERGRGHNDNHHGGVEMTDEQEKLMQRLASSQTFF